MDTRLGRYGEASGTRRKRRRNQEAVAIIYISSKYHGVEDSGTENTGVEGSHM